ncbi:hypothetical protein HPB47_016102 [Ixodes persulcatus]|uniref:Uncharacterized protein n=1 Tax=Ixodes persulcatus TaxID=34615 RepID=A0AC60QU46_IXOPE|nr:hypothetical protein HPB47_016102 [Ixodes persulcatus]
MKESEEVEGSLQSATLRVALRKELSTLGGTTLSNIVRLVMERTVRKEIQLQFSLIGRKGKRSFKGTRLYDVVLVSVSEGLKVSRTVRMRVSEGLKAFLFCCGLASPAGLPPPLRCPAIASSSPSLSDLMPVPSRLPEPYLPIDIGVALQSVTSPSAGAINTGLQQFQFIGHGEVKPTTMLTESVLFAVQTRSSTVSMDVSFGRVGEFKAASNVFELLRVARLFEPDPISAIRVDLGKAREQPASNLKIARKVAPSEAGLSDAFSVSSDDAAFHLDGQVNTENCCCWSLTNPHWTLKRALQSPKVTVWRGIWKEGPFYFDGNVSGDTYLQMMQDKFLPELETPHMQRDLCIFMQDGVPPHWRTSVMHWRDTIFSGRWKGRGSPNIPWPP